MEKRVTRRRYQILERYDLVTIGEEDKLILPLLESNVNILYYITNENIFYDVLHEVHFSIGRGGKHRINAEVKKKYTNIGNTRSSRYLFTYNFANRVNLNKNLKARA